MTRSEIIYYHYVQLYILEQRQIQNLSSGEPTNYMFHQPLHSRTKFRYEEIGKFNMEHSIRVLGCCFFDLLLNRCFDVSWLRLDKIVWFKVKIEKGIWKVKSCLYMIIYLDSDRLIFHAIMKHLMKVLDHSYFSFT